jgi:tetratricopeptide (TPR) repeat protein
VLVGAAVFAAGRHDAAAIQMLEALVLQPANAEAWANLAKCYAALGLVPAPIRSQGSNHVLDDSNPVMRRQLNEACVALVRNYEQARQPQEAQALRELAITRYHVPAGDLGAPEKR